MYPEPQNRSLILVTFVFLTFAMIIFVAAQAYQNLSPDSASASDFNYGNIRYFGYWGTAGFLEGKNFLDEIELNTINVAHIQAIAEPAKMKSYFESAKKKDIKLIVDVFWWFYGPNGTKNANGTAGLALRSDRVQAWATFKQIAAGYEDQIAYFYFDEPILKGVSEFDFRAVTKFLKSEFPQKKVMTVLAYTSFTKANDSYLEYVDAIGFDYYYTFEGTSFETYKAKYVDFLKLVRPNQEVWLIPESYSTSNKPNEIMQVLDSYLRFGAIRPEVVGVLPFLYHNNPEVPKLTHALRDYIVPDAPDYSAAVANQYPIRTPVTVNETPTTPTGSSTPTTTTGGTVPSTSVIPPSQQDTGRCAGDVDGNLSDGYQVNIQDLSIFAKAYVHIRDKKPGYQDLISGYDLTKDGQVGIADLAVFASNYKKPLSTCKIY